MRGASRGQASGDDEGGRPAELLQRARRLLDQNPEDVRLLNLAARAVLQVGGKRAQSEASAWLNRALAIAPGDVETLDRLGRLAWERGQAEAALDYWRRAWTADPDYAPTRGALLQTWRARASAPEWGLPLVEAALADEDDPHAWHLLLDLYARGAEVTPAGLRLLRRRFGQGDRDPRLLAALVGELPSLERLDPPLVLRLAGEALAAPPSAALRPLIESARRVAPGDPRWLRYLAAAARPQREPEAMALYAELFAADPDDRDNTAFLAAVVLAGQPTPADPRAVLAAALRLAVAEPAPGLAALARAGAPAEELAALAPGAGALDDAAHRAFRSTDYAAAEALATALVRLRPDDERARLKQATAATRAALARGVQPADEAPEPLRTLLRAVHGNDVDDASLAAALRSVGDPLLGRVADVLDGVETVPSLAGLRHDPALEALLLRVAGQPEEAAAVLGSGDEPELRLWQRYRAVRDGGADASALLPVARRADAPWTALAPAALDRAVRTAPLAALASLSGRLSAEQARVLSLRQAAASLDAGVPDGGQRVDEVSGELPAELGASLRALAAARAAAGLLRAGRPAEAERALGEAPTVAPELTAAYLWRRALAAWARGDAGAARLLVAQLPEPVRALPSVAWTIAWHDPVAAEPALSLALRHHRDRDDLRRALAALAARAGDAARFTAWAAPFRGQEPAVELVERLLTTPLTQLEPGEDPLVARAVALAWLREGEAARALTALGEHAEPECSAFRAWLLAQSGDAEAARAELAAIEPAMPAVHHNLAVLAEAEGDLATAASEREAVLDETAPEPVRFASHTALARLYRWLAQPSDELRHLEAALALRPDDLWCLRASLEPLLTLGQGDEALRRSERLTRADETLAVQLDHAAVLGATHGAAEAVAFLEDLATRRPESAEAVGHQRQELARRLLEAVREQTDAGDLLSAFTTAREAEAAAATDAEWARAVLHQAVALGRMATGGEAAARLELAYARCQDVLARAVPEGLKAQAQRLAEQVARRLAPVLGQQAEELFRARARDYRRVAQAGGPAAEALRLAEAFERIVALINRASELGGERLAAALAAGRDEANRLATAARALAGEEAPDG